MRANIRHVEGYGWHVGRIIVWPALYLFALGSTFLYAAIDVIAALVIHSRPWVGFVGPLLFALWLRRRLMRKLEGEPFVWDPWWMDEHEVELVRRDAEPERWARLFRLEAIVWGGAIAVQLMMYLFFRAGLASRH